MRTVLINTAGGPGQVIAQQGERLRGFTPDGRSLLLWVMPARGEKVALLNVATGIQSHIVARGDEVFREPRLSADGKWLAFVRSDGQLYVAPFRGSQPIPPSDWIVVADGAAQPAWSPNGKSLYYRSSTGTAINRANVTLLRQPLEPITKRPVGPASVFYRFGGMIFLASIVNPIAVAQDQIVLILTAPSADLWSIDFPHL